MFLNVKITLYLSARKKFSGTFINQPFHIFCVPFQEAGLNCDHECRFASFLLFSAGIQKLFWRLRKERSCICVEGKKAYRISCCKQTIYVAKSICALFKLFLYWGYSFLFLIHVVRTFLSLANSLWEKCNRKFSLHFICVQNVIGSSLL